MAAGPRGIEANRLGVPAPSEDSRWIPCVITRNEGPLALGQGKWKVTPVKEAPTGAEKAIQARLIRCIFCNPFRPVVSVHSWLTPTVITLATAAYEERSLPSGELALDRLAVLADALEDAGCTNADLLDHLRDPSIGHVRGCWALDVILGRS